MLPIFQLFVLQFSRWHKTILIKKSNPILYLAIFYAHQQYQSHHFERNLRINMNLMLTVEVLAFLAFSRN